MSEPEPNPAPPRRRPVRARELRVLNAIAGALNSATDAPQALERALALVAELLGLRG